MARRKILSCALAALLGTSTVLGSMPVPSSYLTEEAIAAVKETTIDSEQEMVAEDSQVNAGNYGLAENTKQGAILHAWCWSFNTIKENLKDIAEAGFTTVQTSPANTCYVGEGGGMELWGNGRWYYHYQPIDWKIGNYQLGSRDDFKAMCEEADKYGVKIIVDVLPNHTASDRGAVTQGLLNAAGGMDKLYHKNWNIGCTNWSDRNQITNYKYSSDGCPDVCTENPGFQAYYVQYLNDLIECGVDGFRYDTAKHIGLPDDPIDEVTRNNGWTNNFWPVALGEQEVNGVKLKGNTNSLFVYGEVLQDQGSRDADYGKLFNLTASNYGGKIRGAIESKNFNANNLNNWENAAGADRLVTWVESHDTYCNEHISAKMSDWDIRMCWAAITARASGTPLFYSRPDGSNGSQGNYWGKNKIGAKGNDQFKDPEVAAVNHFRNAMVGEGEYLSNPNGNSNVLVIERGTKGAVIINLGSDLANVKLNKVADGTYLEEVSGKQVQVSGGTLNHTIPGGTIAVVYSGNPITKDPTVSVSKDSSNFTAPFELTLTPSNADKATYSINGGEEVEITKTTKITIGEGCEIGDKVTLKVTATGEGEPFDKTYTYTMIDAPDVPEAKVYIRVKKSDFSSAPNAYVYTEGTPAKELNGTWDNAGAMTEEGDYYVWYTNDVESAKIIFKYDGGQDPAAETPGYDISGYMEYDKNAKKVTAFTPTPKKTTTPISTVKPTTEPTPDIEPTEKPTETPTQKPSPTPVEEKEIAVSVADKSSFDDETLSVKITLKGEETGTYTVDDGPERNFKSGDSVILGEGKIADTDVTLKVKAGNKAETFTYKKVFNAEKAIVKTSAISRIQSLFEMVAEAAEINAEAISGEPTGLYYSTNPNNQTGSKKTITSASDFTEDMIIAQGVANDDPAGFKGTHEAPKFDQYAMYGAWDENNLYIGIQYTNVIDVVDPLQSAPQEDRGKPYSEDADIPQMLVFDTRTGDYTDGTANDTEQKTAWNIDVKYSGDAKVDKVFCYSPKYSIVNQAFFPVNNGIVDYDNIVKTGYHYVNAERGEKYEDYTIPGVSINWEDGFFGKTMYGIKANGYEGYTPADLSDSSQAWTDFLTTEHNTKYDTFCTITMPLSLLNVTASDIESNGIGVMSIATYGSSGIGSLPMDMTMLDNATDAFSQDDSTSAEKEDSDIVTVALAQLGGSYDGPIKTITPATKAPETEVPASKTPVSEVPATKTPASEIPATETPITETPSADKISVNFGADYSSPQYDSRELVLKAEAKGNSPVKSYEFYVDNKKVQDASEKNCYKWKGEAGKHTIKVVAEYSSGKISCEKNFEIYASGTTTVTDVPKTETPVPTQTAATVEETPAPTQGGEKTSPSPAVPTPTSMVTSSPTQKPDDEKPIENKHNTDIKITFTKSNSTVLSSAAGQKITFYMGATGGAGDYKYRLEVLNASGKKVNLRLKNSSSKNYEKEAVWIATKMGTYKVRVVVTDKDGYYNSRSVTYKITEPITIKSFKASKTIIKKGKKIKFTVKATSYESVKYRFKIQKIGSKTIKTLRGYSAQGTYTWKANAKGKYYVYLQVKDADDNIKQVKKKITVK